MPSIGEPFAPAPSGFFMTSNRAFWGRGMATDTAGSIASAGAPRVVISASLAYDLIMTFPGSFKDHILADKAHVLSVSFLVDSLRKHRGGVAGNIAYNLALLGEPPRVVGAAGADFAPYRA